MPNEITVTGRTLSISESTRKRNPDLFMAGLPAKEPERDRGSEVQSSQLAAGQGGLGFRITLVVLGQRRLDSHDNLRMACKGIVDCITHSLGFKSDDDPRLEWRYHQIQTGRGNNCSN